MVDEQYLDLNTLIRRVFRRGWIIAITFVIAVGLAAAAAFLLPRSYEGSVQFEPGFLTHMRSASEASEDLGGQRVESPGSLTARITSGAYRVRIKDALHIDIADLPGMIVRRDLASPVIQVIARAPSRDRVIETLNTLVALITEDYGPQVEAHLLDLTNELKIMESKIQEKERNKDGVRMAVAQLRIEIRHNADAARSAAEELKQYQRNTDELLKRRQALLESATKPDPLTMLLFDNQIQGNLSQSADLRDKIVDFQEKESSAKRELTDKEVELQNLQNQIDQARLQLETSRAESKVVSELRIMQPVFVPDHPSWPPRSIILIGGSLAGLFLGLSIALVVSSPGFSQPRS